MDPNRVLPSLVALTLLAAVPLAGQAPEPEPPSAGPELREALVPFVHALTVTEGRLEGPGAAVLLQEAEKAHLFMLGEQHATAEIADLATALFRALAPLGYQHAAIEVGPVGARRLEALLRDEDPGALAEYFATGTNLLSIPFYFFEEEARFVRAVVDESSAPAPVLWGLDQEFIAGAGPALDRLEELSATEEERAAVAAAREAAEANPMFLGTAPPERLEALSEAFAASESAEARALATQLVATNRIYAPFTGRGGTAYEANREREDLMKTNFLGHYRRVKESSGARPRVFVKLGANHLFRGLSPTHVLSFGSFAFDLAVADGVEAYNLHVDCRGGEAMNAMTAAPGPCESYFLGAESALATALPADRTVLVDLQALRSEPGLLERLDEASRELVWAYDGYVAVPDAHAATFFPGERPSFGQ